MAARPLGRQIISVLLAAGALGTLTACDPPSSITLAGRGYGHGRGMGQWGAYGYAVDHAWSGTQILEHFYGNTTRSVRPTDSLQRVYLTGSDGAEVILYNSLAGLSTSVDAYSGSYSALRIRRVDSTRFQVFSGPTCAGPWAVLADSHTSSTIRVKPPVGAPDDSRSLIQRCTTSGNRYYRGDMLAVQARGTIVAVNDVSTEYLVRSVIAKEVSPSWADAGGGRGAAAVRAQAVAARSYALAGDTRWAGYATTCDSTSCQVYGGYGFRSSSSSTVIKVEDPRTDKATADTARTVRLTAGGAVARTEFGPSSGGWTSPGNFPAVRDDGDDTTANPNHTWTTTIPRETFEAAFDRYRGVDVGTYEGIDILSRNGLGADGGRILTARVRFTGVDVTLSGDSFRSVLGLKSNWFSVVG